MSIFSLQIKKFNDLNPRPAFLHHLREQNVQSHPASADSLTVDDRHCLPLNH